MNTILINHDNIINAPEAKFIDEPPKGKWLTHFSLTCEIEMTHKEKRRQERLLRQLSKKRRFPRKVKKAIKTLFLSACKGSMIINTKQKRKICTPIFRYLKEHKQ